MLDGRSSDQVSTSCLGRLSGFESFESYESYKPPQFFCLLWLGRSQFLFSVVLNFPDPDDHQNELTRKGKQFVVPHDRVAVKLQGT